MCLHVQMRTGIYLQLSTEHTFNITMTCFIVCVGKLLKEKKSKENEKIKNTRQYKNSLSLLFTKVQNLDSFCALMVMMSNELFMEHYSKVPISLYATFFPF